MTAPVNCPELKPSTSTFVRWCKFNLVGGMGIVVQFVALFLLKSGLHFDYLLATAVAVEAAVVHNFVWHEQFTWVDRVSPHPFKEETIRTKAETICTKADKQTRLLLKQKRFVLARKRFVSGDAFRQRVRARKPLRL